MKKFAYCLALSLVAVGCSDKADTVTDKYEGLTQIEYEESKEIFANPERGFFVHLEDFSSKGLPSLSPSMLENQRLQGRSLVYTIHYLDSFVESLISDEYLDALGKSLQVLRDSGVKCVLRFAYNRSYAEDAHPWDAAPGVVLRHIAQLKPIFQEYYDVILCLEAGFVGTFGEWYYTDNYVFNPQTAEDFAARRELVDALLDAMPADRQILVRYPMAKLKMYGWDIADSLTVATAHDGSPKSRIAHHNDCFLSSANDVGTYRSNREREYVYSESRYTIWGGETCALQPYSDADRAIDMMEKHHMTYLNSSYHQDVISKWRTQGVLPDIMRRMGYRFVLDKAYITPEPVAGEPMRIALEIRNDGFAAPQNPRGIELVLRNVETGEENKMKVDSDPRFWFENSTSTVDVSFTAPASGTYEVLLNLPDPVPALYANPEFSIRLANKNMWEPGTGYNKITSFSL